MDGFLWLVSQMILLLTAAAVVFFVLGWRWRGRGALRVTVDSAPGSPQVEPPSVETGQAPASVTDARLQADLQEANDHRRNLERELIRVHEELKAARRDAGLHQEDMMTAKAEAKRLAARNEELEKEKSRLEKEVARLQTEQAAAVRSATPAAEPAPVPEVAAKPVRPTKKPRATVLKSTSSKPAADADSTLTRLQKEIEARQTLVAALRQEQEDWRRKVASLREKGGDPAGLGLARKSLERVEEQVGEAAATLLQLQHQQSALRHSLEQAERLEREDDLTRIKGIKSVLRDQLHAFGIRSFRQIAEWTDTDVEAFSQLLSFKDRARRDQWVRQARELSEQAPEQENPAPQPQRTQGEG
jgi:predicted flap endonuclease-1-like 5' DNA nuclease